LTWGETLVVCLVAIWIVLLAGRAFLLWLLDAVF
jgi:hypothetical protein